MVCCRVLVEKRRVYALREPKPLVLLQIKKKSPRVKAVVKKLIEPVMLHSVTRQADEAEWSCGVCAKGTCSRCSMFTDPYEDDLPILKNSLLVVSQKLMFEHFKSFEVAPDWDDYESGIFESTVDLSIFKTKEKDA